MNQTIRVDPDLWDEFTVVANRQRKRPKNLVVKLIRDYLQIQKDLTLFVEMRHDLRGREMTDEEAVQFVHDYRREKRARRSTERKS